jgi:hypothetical protein
MTWTQLFKWIAIIYIPYYAINIAYDIYQYHKKKKKEEDDNSPIIYDLSHLFANDVQPKVVLVENSTPPANPVHKEQQKGEGGEMVVKISILLRGGVKKSVFNRINQLKTLFLFRLKSKLLYDSDFRSSVFILHFR